MTIAIPAEGVKLNVGCGRHVLDGWVNADVVRNPKAKRDPELLCDVGSIPLPDGSVKELMGIHILEHLFPWEVPAVLGEWRRVMRPRARLVLEMPDLFKFCANILESKPGRKHPDQLGMWGLYGDPTSKDPLMMHKWGWTFVTLAPVLEARGFGGCREERPEWHEIGRDTRDFRIVAYRD